MLRADDEEVEPLRFLDILTTATAIASARNSNAVGVEEMLLAAKVTNGDIDITDIEGSIHPLLIRGSTERPVDRDVRALVQRWYSIAGGDAAAVLTAEQLSAFVRELEKLRTPRAQ